MFTGAAYTPCTATVTGPNGLNQALAVTYTNNVNAGTATATASFAGNATYLASSDRRVRDGKATTTTIPVVPLVRSCSRVAPYTPCTATVTGPAVSTRR